MPWRSLAAYDSRSAGGVPVPALWSAFSRGAFFAPFVRLLLAAGGAGGGPLLDGLLRAGFVRLARA